jgi:GNAT superfamily N-acetyltransferase
LPFVAFLSPHHDRASFDCGKEPLNRYLREVARQSADRNLGVTQVVVPEPQAAAIMGYFTLLTRTVEAATLSEKRLPMGAVGVALLGRLATDRRYAGQGLGERMLLRAMAETETAARRIGIYALVVDALDEEARAWYLKRDFGFKPMRDDAQRLYVSQLVAKFGAVRGLDSLSDVA